MNVNQYNTTLACNIPRKLSLRNPYNGETLRDAKGNTVDIYLYGMLSDHARNAVKSQARHEDRQDDQVGGEILAALTQGWSDNLEDDDGPIPFTRERAARLYIEQDWIANQVLAFVKDLGNFNPRLYETRSDGSKRKRGSTAPREAQK